MKRDDELTTFIVILLFVALLFFGAVQWSRMSKPPHISGGDVTLHVSPSPSGPNE